MKEFPLVSIIIVNYNGLSLLKECFESLKKVNYPNFEIILVDNGSSDGSVDFIKKYYPKTIFLELGENLGFALPNNKGVKKSNGTYLLFLNNDTIVSENFVSELVNIMELDKDVGIAQSLLLTKNGQIDSSGDFMDSLGICFNSKKKVKEVSEIFSAKGASMIIRRKLFEKLDGFDEKFFLTFEDVDLGWRSQILGYKVVVIPSSIVYHIGNKTINRIKKQVTFHGYKNQISMKFTNYELSKAIKTLILFFLVYGIRELKIWFDYQQKGQTDITATKYEDKIALKPSIGDIFRALGWIIKNILYLYKKRKWISKNRKLSTDQIMSKFSI